MKSGVINYQELMPSVIIDNRIEKLQRIWQNLYKVKNEVKQSQLDEQFFLPDGDYGNHRIPVTKLNKNFLQSRNKWTLRQLQCTLKQIFSNTIGYEYMHISEPKQKKFIMQKAIEAQKQTIGKQQRIKNYQNITKTEAFNHFLNQKFKTSKRFGIEGVDTLISGLDTIIQLAAKQGIQYIALGMSHRGRLNTLATVFQKPMEQIFAQFQEIQSGNQWGNSGDVKYHLGCTVQKQYNGKQIRLSILPNPSHLEAANPVVMGTAKAVQHHFGDQNGDKVMAILIHGDAALAGQGIVYQTLQMQNLKSFSNKGVIHIVANNQIGFTTTPAEARTGLYCTDVAKAIKAPIIHVNADNPDEVVYAMNVAFEYRKIQLDIVDMGITSRISHRTYCFISFTQPMMYKQINSHKKVYDKYSQELLKEGIITEEYKKQKWQKYIKKLQVSYLQSKKQQFNLKQWQQKPFYHIVQYSKLGILKDTGVKVQILKQIGRKITGIPEHINMHPQIAKIMGIRRNAYSTGKGIDFASAEALAFGSLLEEGFKIRLSGQDVQRGTFSHRHAYIVDQKVDFKYQTFRSLLTHQQYKNCQIQNSLLSQYGCLGFQYGYTLANPNVLVLWEAQFGDFANGAQIMIDNFISSGESKWGISSGLCMLLPHGMDGQGPEHSSGRMERFLQLMNDDLSIFIEQRKERIKRQIYNSNMQIICPSFAANYFHALRRQMRRTFRKPLISFNSKKLLKKKQVFLINQAFSDYDPFTENHRFFTVMPQADEQYLVQTTQIKYVFVCSGQVYYDIIENRKEYKRNDIAVIRVEQIAPFPYDYFKKITKKYVNARFYWFQEEHKNAGAWSYIHPRMGYILQQMKNEKLINHSDLQYIGRKASGSPATGSKKIHQVQTKMIMQYAFNGLKQ